MLDTMPGKALKAVLPSIAEASFSVGKFQCVKGKDGRICELRSFWLIFYEMTSRPRTDERDQDRFISRRVWEMDTSLDH